jgi:hypothetical protein
MTEPPIALIQKCRECGAENDAHAKNCWLCYSKDMKRVPVVVTETIAKRAEEKPAKPIWAPGENATLVLVASVTLLAIIVGLGIYSLSPAALILYFIVCVPALLALIIRASLKQARGEQISTTDALTTFFLTGLTVLISGTAILGLLAILILVAIASLFEACFKVFEQMGGAH